MKNIFIINQRSRAMSYGVGTYTQQLISALQLLSVRITVVTLSADLFDLEISERDGVRYIMIPVPASERYIRFFSKKDDERYLRNVYYMLLPYIPKNESVVFHFNFQELGGLAYLLKEHFMCKIVTTMHYSHWSFNLLGDREKLYSILKQDSHESQENKTRELFFMEQKFYREIADYIISISKHSYDDLINIYGISSSKIILIPNGIKDEYRKINDDGKRELRKYFYLEEDEKLLLFVGRVTPIKGIDYLLKAFKDILKIRKDVRLMIIGESSEEDLRYYQSLTYPFYSEISFNGFVSKEKLADIYSITDLGIVSSIHEEFGYVAIEMLMHGIPIIANKTTGLKDIIQDGINGSCFQIQKNDESASISELTAKIIDLLDDPEKRIRYIQKGREYFCRKYDLSVFSQHIKDFYLQINS